MKPFSIKSSVVLALILSLVCAWMPAIALPVFAVAPPDDIVLRAVKDELARSISSLVIPGQEKPYFIEYEVIEAEAVTITASFGGVLYSQSNRGRAVTVDVRVGGYEFDNEPSSFPSPIVIEDDYNALRHELWLATDIAYRRAVEQLSRKRAFLKNRTDDEKIPDFSQEAPFELLQPRQDLKVDRVKWEKLVREWSAIFKQFPAIKQSNVTFQAQLLHRYLVNSEGTTTRRPILLVSIEAAGAAQAADGSWVTLSSPVSARTLDQLPPAADVAKSINQMAGQLTKLQAAPLLSENYLGPVLFTGPASADLFAQLLGPELCSQRPSVGMQGEDKSELVNRLNRRVLPFHISIYDDPTIDKFNGQALLGSYGVDEQGVPSKRISLVEQGVLKNLLMSRRPRKSVLKSNGHGRAGMGGGVSTEIGNLIVSSSDGKSQEQLKEELIKMCKAQDMTFGVIIRGGGLSDPGMTYKVYVDSGREELVRGANIGELTVKQLKAQIIAAGNDSFVLNRAGTNGGISTTVVAPSVLLEELELKKPTGAKQKPLIMTHPYFDKP